jgi:hypothetical protein
VVDGLRFQSLFDTVTYDALQARWHRTINLGSSPTSASVAFWRGVATIRPGIESGAPPSLRNQEGQVVDPIFLADSAWIDNVAQVIFGIRNNKIGVGN